MSDTVSGGVSRCKQLGVALTRWQRTAIVYLERQGLTFGAQFGYKNAIQVARGHWVARKRGARKKETR
jgi:hypothetical protein